MAEIFRAVGPGIDAALGPNLSDLRRHSYSVEQFTQFQMHQRVCARKNEAKAPHQSQGGINLSFLYLSM